MATIAVSLRYHAETDTYYIQIQGAEYARLNTQIRHITAYLGHIQDGKHTEERSRLAERRKCLLQERRQSQYYVKIFTSDVPESVRARPIYNITGQIVTALPEQYAELLAMLQRRKGTGDES